MEPWQSHRIRWSLCPCRVVPMMHRHCSRAQRGRTRVLGGRSDPHFTERRVRSITWALVFSLLPGLSKVQRTPQLEAIFRLCPLTHPHPGMYTALVTVRTKRTACTHNNPPAERKAHSRMRGILQRAAPSLPVLLNHSVQAKAPGILEKWGGRWPFFVMAKAIYFKERLMSTKTFLWEQVCRPPSVGVWFPSTTGSFKKCTFFWLSKSSVLITQTHTHVPVHTDKHIKKKIAITNGTTEKILATFW